MDHTLPIVLVVLLTAYGGLSWLAARRRPGDARDAGRKRWLRMTLLFAVLVALVIASLALRTLVLSN